jgi:hypothetical protein
VRGKAWGGIVYQLNLALGENKRWEDFDLSVRARSILAKPVPTPRERETINQIMKENIV